MLSNDSERTHGTHCPCVHCENARLREVLQEALDALENINETWIHPEAALKALRGS
jgi:hypothetical protein